jgi:mannose/cellobiose epimerase-like protein (N-acyl-D-glucosamine 2-epimerase family)
MLRSIQLSVCLLAVIITGRAQPTYSSEFIYEPESLIGFVRDCAEFWSGVEDELHGGFFVSVGRSGNVLNSNTKGIVSQSRDAYGFARAFMLTGDATYLEKARSALTFMYDHLWDEQYGGWYKSTSRDGCCPIPTIKTAFDQHYGLLGITAMFEATGDSLDWEMLMAGYEFNEDRLWDSDSLLFGYFHQVSRSGEAPTDKSFNATVDAITTHLYSLYLLTGDERFYDRLMQLKRNIIDRLIASMEDQVIGFAEHYGSDWTVDQSEDRTIMGHVLKTAWSLARIYRLQADQESVDGSELLVQEVLDKAYDHVFGGPYKDYIRTTGEMLMYGAFDTAKAWWQMEQAVMAGFLLFEITWEPEYLEMADKSLDFYMKYFVDPQYGEVYADRSREGGRVQYSGGFWDENKGSDWKAAYHSIETGYYSYIYSKLLIKQEPLTLYYKYGATQADRLLNYNPVALDFDDLMIIDVTLDGNPYADFDSTDRQISIPAGVAGTFAVTYAMDGLGPVVYEMVSAVKPATLNVVVYPNPATDRFIIQAGGNGRSSITLSDQSGRLVKVLSSNLSQIEIDVSDLAAGIYTLQVETPTERGVKNIIKF